MALAAAILAASAAASRSLRLRGHFVLVQLVIGDAGRVFVHGPERLGVEEPGSGRAGGREKETLEPEDGIL